MDYIAYTVYDSQFDAGHAIPGAFVAAFAVETQADADLLLAKYGDAKRYDVRPCTLGAVSAVAMEIAERVMEARRNGK